MLTTTSICQLATSSSFKAPSKAHSKSVSSLPWGEASASPANINSSSPHAMSVPHGMILLDMQSSEGGARFFFRHVNINKRSQCCFCFLKQIALSVPAAQSHRSSMSRIHTTATNQWWGGVRLGLGASFIAPFLLMQREFLCYARITSDPIWLSSCRYRSSVLKLEISFWDGKKKPPKVAEPAHISHLWDKKSWLFC